MKLIPAVACVACAIALSGCSSTSSYSAIAQQASAAASSVRAVTVSLKLESGGRVLSSITDTSVEDAVTKLVDADGSLTAMALTGRERAARDRALSQVRTAEDAMLSLRAGLSTRRSAAIGRAASLVRLAKKLTALSTALESK